jgi:hypothetical protein
MRKLKCLMVPLLFVLLSTDIVNSQVVIPDPPKENLCRCRKGGCFGGNQISLNSRCGQGSCADGSSNCPYDAPQG